MTQSMTSIGNIVLLILDSGILIEKQTFMLLDELFEFAYSDLTRRPDRHTQTKYYDHRAGISVDHQDGIAFASLNLEVRIFFWSPSSDAEYNLRNVYVACTTCVANPAFRARTDEEISDDI